MPADMLQNVTVVAIVCVAVGYLGVVLRRSWKGQAGCGSCHSGSVEPREETKPVQKLFMPAENLSDAAERLRKERSTSDKSDP